MLAVNPAFALRGESNAQRVACELTFSSIYRQQLRFVWRSLRACGVPEAHVPDAGQEVFLIVHRRLNDFDPSTNVRTWLYAIVRRVAANHRRSHTRLRQRESRGAGPSCELQNPESSLQIRQDLERIQSFLDSLEPASRDIFYLFHVEDISLREIGELLELNVNTVNTRLRAVRRRFRTYWLPRVTKAVPEDAPACG